MEKRGINNVRYIVLAIQIIIFVLLALFIPDRYPPIICTLWLLRLWFYMRIQKNWPVNSSTFAENHAIAKVKLMFKPIVVRTSKTTRSQFDGGNFNQSISHISGQCLIFIFDFPGSASYYNCENVWSNWALIWIWFSFWFTISISVFSEREEYLTHSFSFGLSSCRLVCLRANLFKQDKWLAEQSE